MRNRSRMLAGMAVGVLVLAGLFVARAQPRAAGRGGRGPSREAPKRDPRAGRGAAVKVARYDVNVPGFDMKRYTKFLSGMRIEYPRQITKDDEMDLIPIGSRLSQYFTGKKGTKEDALSQWTDYVMGLIEYIGAWDNVLLAEYDGEKVALYVSAGYDPRRGWNKYTFE